MFFKKRYVANLILFGLALVIFGLIVKSANCKPCKREGFEGGNFIDYYKKDFRVLDNEDYGNAQDKNSKFYDPYASYQILDLHKGNNLTFGKPLDEGIPFKEENIDAKDRQLQELKFLSKLKNISRLTETQFKETKLTKLYPAQIKAGINQMREAQPYNVGTISSTGKEGDVTNTLDVRTDQDELKIKQDNFVKGATFDENRFMDEGSKNMIKNDAINQDTNSKAALQL